MCVAEIQGGPVIKQSIFHHAIGNGPCARCRFLWFAFALVLGALVMPTSIQGWVSGTRSEAPPHDQLAALER